MNTKSAIGINTWHGHQDAAVAPIRHMDFGFNEQPTPRYVYADNAYASTLFMAISIIIPRGERFFIESVRNYQSDISNPVLASQVVSFIGQEAMHGKMHDEANASMADRGVPLAAMNELADKGYKLAARYLPKSVQLGYTLAMEHFTAMISEFTLQSLEEQQRLAPEFRDFALWHMMEELEHKSVAYDVYEKVVADHGLRVASMVASTAVMGAALQAYQLVLLWKDGTLFDVRDHWRGIRMLVGKRGPFGFFAKRYVEYFARDFHPDQHETDQLLARLREQYFGDKGQLSRYLTRTVQPALKSVGLPL